MLKFIVEPEYDNYEIGSYLKEVHAYSSRRIRNLEIYLNGKRVKNTSKKVRKLSRIVVVEKEKSTNIRAIEMNLDIVYEDENLLVINKEANLVVHPTQKKTDITLANGVVYYFREKLARSSVPRFFNRLDMNTTGLIIITKNAHSQNFLQKHGEVQKKYLALANGIVEQDDFLIDIPIGRIGDELRRIRLSEEDGGQYAKTRVRVLKRLARANISLCEIELLTGRTHQIRAHFSIIGHPLVGDELYGGKREEFSVKRQMLHAYYLSFNTPSDKRRIELKIEAPKDMQDLIEEVSKI